MLCHNQNRLLSVIELSFTLALVLRVIHEEGHLTRLPKLESAYGKQQKNRYSAVSTVNELGK